MRCLGEIDATFVVVDPSPAGRAEAVAVAPGATVVDDADAVLRDASIGAVMIATPAETHFGVARAAACTASTGAPNSRRGCTRSR